MQYKLWIDGQWVDSAGGGKMRIENPATGEQIAEAQDATRADVDSAVQAAKRAFYDGRWSRLTPGERSKAIWRFAELLEKNSEEFARVESENTGKPYKFLSLASDVPFTVDNLKFFAAAARDTHGSHAGEFMAGYTSMYRREPVGVIGQITPWNYPLNMAGWKIGPALAAGCTIVLKPAPGTPLTTLMLAELTKEAGIPDGVVNILSGGNDAGQAIAEHPDVRMVCITGSVGTGKKVMRTAADTLKRVHLELGGKAPFIVFDDSDPELVAAKASFAATANTGQDCTAATRIYVEKGRAKDMREAVVEAMKNVKVGSPFDDSVVMGPLISGGQRERVMGFVERAKSQGAKVLTGGGVPKELDKGYFYSPTVIAGVEQDWEIVQQEVFGPVITIQEFENESQALHLGNDVLYGLAASVFTKDVGRAMRLTGQLEFGTVWINDHLPITSETPHGGFKQSGFGKDLSAEAVGDYQITKHVMIAHG
ncbi:MAG: gamma-aminobutyraldehyde dehydrogenase [Chloroflexi bacterium]|nr:gamma-aminobutyraldehyde dehydrogenase [Chloroflexi bacterium CFX1]MCK6566751.1 gamma-aminobutyraldehyde dehydrogenase [Anaerolineales bacterium]MCQ3952901.1 gamma-aminobutyraldehyde dehydrogenase [Chloroflexota bacterium]MDL1918247.1 gamma-aminobutyraldehyde dehydrogenase [Chloroflexi bacterium CFX5]NUQ59996.1 gamma-aminobutyraldehyde dehydrogenase [Anaerolineales bacterium]